MVTSLLALAKNIGGTLVKKGLTVGVCESCTSGRLGVAITAIPGSSRYFLGGVIAYADGVKERIVGVRRRTLVKYGAVSPQTVREMAQGVRIKLRADCGIAVTGIAGPSGGTGQKPVGTVYLAVADRGRTVVKRCRFSGSRNAVRNRSCRAALLLLKGFLAEMADGERRG
jgi:PncC family amidohydrolase